MHLKHACLPISPPEQMNENEHSIPCFAQSHKGVFSLFKKSLLAKVNAHKVWALSWTMEAK